MFASSLNRVVQGEDGPHCILRLLVPNSKLRIIDQNAAEVAEKTGAVITVIDDMPRCGERVVVVHCYDATALQPTYMRRVALAAMTLPCTLYSSSNSFWVYGLPAR